MLGTQSSLVLPEGSMLPVPVGAPYLGKTEKSGCVGLIVHRCVVDLACTGAFPPCSRRLLV